MTTELRALSEETIANLVEVTQDPIDAMKLAADVYAMSAYRTERASAAAAGGATPRPPRPHSKYLRMLTTGLRAKLMEIMRRFNSDELDRLRRIGPFLLVRMSGDDPGLTDQIVQLLCMAPEDAVAWIREHLDEIEARFAS
jgi:hypothetical protein